MSGEHCRRPPCGLLDESQRSDGGHRLCTAEAVTVVRMINAAQRLNFTRQEVVDLMEADTRPHRRPGDGLHRRVQDKLTEVDAKIADLTVIRQTLTDALARLGRRA